MFIYLSPINHQSLFSIKFQFKVERNQTQDGISIIQGRCKHNTDLQIYMWTGIRWHLPTYSNGKERSLRGLFKDTSHQSTNKNLISQWAALKYECLIYSFIKNIYLSAAIDQALCRCFYPIPSGLVPFSIIIIQSRWFFLDFTKKERIREFIWNSVNKLFDHFPSTKHILKIYVKSRFI